MTRSASRPPENRNSIGFAECVWTRSPLIDTHGDVAEYWILRRRCIRRRTRPRGRAASDAPRSRSRVGQPSRTSRVGRSGVRCRRTRAHQRSHASRSRSAARSTCATVTAGETYDLPCRSSPRRRSPSRTARSVRRTTSSAVAGSRWPRPKLHARVAADEHPDLAMDVVERRVDPAGDTISLERLRERLRDSSLSLSPTPMLRSCAACSASRRSRADIPAFEDADRGRGRPAGRRDLRAQVRRLLHRSSRASSPAPSIVANASVSAPSLRQTELDGRPRPSSRRAGTRTRDRIPTRAVTASSLSSSSHTTGPTAENTASARSRVAFVACDPAASAVTPLPTRAGVFGIARTTDEPWPRCVFDRLGAHPGDDRHEPVGADGSTRICSSAPAASCGFTASRTPRACAARIRRIASRRGTERVADLLEPRRSTMSAKIRSSGVHPCASRPRASASPIIPAPINASLFTVSAARRAALSLDLRLCAARLLRERVHIEIGFRGTAVFDRRTRRRRLRDEQRAAVLEREGSTSRTCRCAFASSTISCLSTPISGRSTGSVATSSTQAMFSSVCEATCPRLSPVTSALRPSRLGDDGRDPHHQPPVEHDAELRRRRHHDLLLRVADRDLVERRRPLPLGDRARELGRLARARPVREGGRVEVDEDRLRSALQDPERRDRRVDPAGEQRDDLAGRRRRADRPDRRSARRRRTCAARRPRRATVASGAERFTPGPGRRLDRRTELRC